MEVVSEQQQDMEQTFERLLLRTHSKIQVNLKNIFTALVLIIGEEHPPINITPSNEAAGAENVLSEASNSARSLSSSPEQGEDDRDQPSLSASSKFMQTEPLCVQLPRVKTEGLLRPSLSVTDTRSSADPLSGSESDTRDTDLFPSSTMAGMGVDHSQNSGGMPRPNSTREKLGSTRDSKGLFPSSSKPPRHPGHKRMCLYCYA